MNGPTDLMRILAWNCRGIGGPSTISQLKESIRLNFPGIIFICETKQSKGFMGTVCKKLKFGKRWMVIDPIGRKRGMLAAWSEQIDVRIIGSSEFYLEMQVRTGNEREYFWVIFLHASTDPKVRLLQ